MLPKIYIFFNTIKYKLDFNLIFNNKLVLKFQIMQTLINEKLVVAKKTEVTNTSLYRYFLLGRNRLPSSFRTVFSKAMIYSLLSNNK